MFAYDLVCMRRGNGVNVGVSLKTQRFKSDKENLSAQDLIPIAKEFFSDIATTNVNLSEPTLEILRRLSVVALPEELNDLVCTLDYFGISFLIIKNITASGEEVLELNQEAGAKGYLLLPNQNILSIPKKMLYDGWSVDFIDTPSYPIGIMEVGKLMPTYLNYETFTTIVDDKNFYDGLKANKEVDFYSSLDMLDHIQNCGYEAFLVV